MLGRTLLPVNLTHQKMLGRTLLPVNLTHQKVLDHDKGKDDPLGYLELPLRSLPVEKLHEAWFDVQDGKGSIYLKMVGTTAVAKIDTAAVTKPNLLIITFAAAAINMIAPLPPTAPKALNLRSIISVVDCAPGAQLFEPPSVLPFGVAKTKDDEEVCCHHRSNITVAS